MQQPTIIPHPSVASPDDAAGSLTGIREVVTLEVLDALQTKEDMNDLASEPKHQSSTPSSAVGQSSKSSSSSGGKHRSRARDPSDCLCPERKEMCEPLMRYQILQIQCLLASSIQCLSVPHDPIVGQA
jgi:hypothetical protein